jgi:hypothetical protein
MHQVQVVESHGLNPICLFFPFWTKYCVNSLMWSKLFLLVLSFSWSWLNLSTSASDTAWNLEDLDGSAFWISFEASLWTIFSNRSNISVGISSENKVHVGGGGISVGTSGLSFLWAVDVAEGIEIVGCNKVVDVVDIILEGK